MSVIDNLLTGAYLRTDKREIQQDLERMLDLFPILAERGHQAAGTLSGGEQQMCRGIVVDSGRIKIIGPPSELADNPMVQEACVGLI
jgi:ABC-type lipoprotein export system ATPase subunit